MKRVVAIGGTKQELKASVEKWKKLGFEPQETITARYCPLSGVYLCQAMIKEE